MTELEPPIFVVGCFRGGTTLVERVLLSHPDVAGPGFETQLFSRVRYGRPLDHPAEYEAFTRRVRANGDAVARFAAAAAAVTREQSARCWVEKSPEHVYHARAIADRFAGARFVHVLRDGRDVVTSILHTPWALPRTRGRRSRVVAGALLWEQMTLAGLRLLADPALEGAVLGIRYESLVRSPGSELRRLARFLRLPDDDESIERWLSATEAIEGNSLIEPDIRGVRASPVDRWRDRRNLGDRELATIQYLVGPTLVRAGYGLVETEPLARGARARIAAAKAGWLAIRMQRYATTIGRGLPRRVVGDVGTSLASVFPPRFAGR